MSTPPIMRDQDEALSAGVGNDSGVRCVVGEGRSHFNRIESSVADQMRHAPRHVVVDQEARDRRPPHAACSADLQHSASRFDIRRAQFRELLQDSRIRPSAGKEAANRRSAYPSARDSLLPAENAPFPDNPADAVSRAKLLDRSREVGPNLLKGHVNRHDDLAWGLGGLVLTGRTQVQNVLRSGDEKSNGGKWGIHVQCRLQAP